MNKRRRENDAPTTSSIAASNASLRHFMGGQKRNTWLDGAAGVAANGSASTNAISHQQNAHNSARNVPNAASINRQPVNPPPGMAGPATFQQPNSFAGPIPQTTNVPPLRLSTGGSPVINDHSLAKQTYPSNALSSSSQTRQGLLSPALSDGTNKNPSPVITNTPHPQNGAPRSEKATPVQSTAPPRAPFVNSAGDILPWLPYSSLGQSTATAAQGRQPWPSTNRTPAVPSTQHAPSPINTQVIPHQGQQQMRTSSFNNNSGPASPANIPTRGPFVHPAPPQPAQPVLQIPYDTAHLTMMIEAQMQPILRCSKTTPRDQGLGRLNLLLDAVRREDWFYITLSQMMCLNSVAPTLLPKIIKDVSPAFATVEILLCRNSEINQGLVRWLSEFPQPVMGILTSTEAQRSASLNAAVHQVARFLRSFPKHWTDFLAICQQRETPPLAEEMSEQLLLDSPVLQATIFRAMARAFSGGDNSDEPGISALDKLHQLNRVAFQKNYRIQRDARGKAINSLKAAVHAWRIYKSNFRLMSQAAREEMSPFQLPVDIVEFFKLRGVNAAVDDPIPPSTTCGPAPTVRRTSDPQAPQMHPQLRQSHPRTVPSNAPVDFVFPRMDDTLKPMPLEPDTARTALHQAHLRDPILRPSEPNEQLYRYASHFVLPPVRIDHNLPMATVSFTLSKADIDCMPKTMRSDLAGSNPILHLSENNETFRLRCVSIPSGGISSDSVWHVADTTWPSNMMFDLNDQPLELRRKLHHKRCQPVELAPYVREGENTLLVSINRSSTDTRVQNFAIAIEAITTTKHSTMLSAIQTIPAKTALEKITLPLASSTALLAAANLNDDDLAITSQTLNISLLDPISGTKNLTTPVRSSTCNHADVFDLNTFLASRPREAEPLTFEANTATPEERTHKPSTPDSWRCPICRADARPHLLSIDGFVVQVREKLEGRDVLEEVDSITVHPDGKWEAKTEAKTGVRSSSLEAEERGMVASGGGGGGGGWEVIELD